jgi:ABC-type glycerol-3-phosphate transport system substrate-binding protein
MDNKTKKFQTILLIVLSIGLALGLMIFGGVIKTPQKNTDGAVQASGTVVMWGPFSNSIVSPFINEFNEQNKNSVVNYVGFTEGQFDEELLEAFARGEAPDLILLPHTLISRYRDKVIVLGEDILPERNFKDLYSQGAEIFRLNEGTVGLPVAVDPLVMYYNRDIIESSGIINPPLFWNEDFLSFVQQTTSVESSDGLTVERSGAPLGETSNINHADYIFSALAMQLGSPITIQTEAGFQAVLSETSLVTNAPGASALEYFTNFSNPSNVVYSWNKEMPEARDAFALGQTAVYFGLASELLEIQRKNPNLNFDVTKLPQIKELNKSLTYGNFYALVVPKTSKNTAGAFSIGGVLATGSYTSAFIDALGLQPVRRDLLATTPTNGYGKIFFDSAIISRSWINPNPKVVSTIVSEMVSAVTSGRLAPERAVTEAEQKIYEAF